MDAVPNARALELGQDRLVEKELFRRLGIATAAFGSVEEVGLPALVKSRRFGYDGKGQRVVETTEALGVDELAEAIVPFDRELSIVAVRGSDGSTAFYPLTENEHRGGILAVSRAPARDAPQAAAERLAAKLLDDLDYVGVLAVELFDVGGELLANEFAPRVHNTGHWTIDGAETSQFENHLRAILGLPLGSTAARGDAVMVNLVGSLPPLERLLAVPGAHVHLYGKEPRPGRKLGHVTLVDADEAAVAERRRACRRCLAELGLRGRSVERPLAPARVRVGLEVRLAASAIRHVRVALGRPEIGVAEHLLHRAEIGAALEEVRREGVAEEVRVDATRLEPCAFGQLAKDQERAGAGERAAARVEEQLGPVAPVEMGPAEGEVAAHGLGGRPPERDEPFLAALSEHAHNALLDRDAVLLQPDRLRHTEAGAVHELHERAIAQRPRHRPRRGVDQPLGLGGRERAG